MHSSWSSASHTYLVNDHHYKTEDEHPDSLQDNEEAMIAIFKSILMSYQKYASNHEDPSKKLGVNFVHIH